MAFIITHMAFLYSSIYNDPTIPQQYLDSQSLFFLFQIILEISGRHLLP